VRRLEENNNANLDVIETDKKLIYIFNSQAIGSQSFVSTMNDLKKDPTYEITICDYVDEIIQMSAVNPCMIIFAAVTSKADVVEIIKLLTKLKTFIKMNFVKVLLFNYVKGGKVEQLFRKHGVGDFLDDAINARSLGYKLNLMLKAIETNYKKYKDQRKIEKEVKTFHSNSDPFSILKFIKPINQQFEIWSIENKKKLTFFNGTWEIEVEGPSIKLGEWKDGGGENDLKLWQWKFFDGTLNDEFSPEGMWIFEGKKPEFYTASSNWKFSSKAPNFYFTSELTTTFKIEFDEENMQIAKDSRLLQTNLSQLKTLSSLLEDKNTTPEDIKAMLSGENEQKVESYNKGESHGTEQLDGFLAGDSAGGVEKIDDNMVGESSGSTEEINTYQTGKGAGAVDRIESNLRGDVSSNAIEEENLWKTLGDVEDLGGYLKGDIKETDKADGVIYGKVDEIDYEKGIMEGLQDNDSLDKNNPLVGKINSTSEEINKNDLINQMKDEFISDNLRADVGPGLQVRNKYDVSTEKKQKAKEEIEKENQGFQEEERKREALRNKLAMTENDPNMTGNGESADRLHTHWTDTNHKYSGDEKKYNEWAQKSGDSNITQSNMMGNGESADDIDKFWRDPLHQMDSRDKEYHDLQKAPALKLEKKMTGKDASESKPSVEVDENEPLRKKKTFLKNSRGSWVTEEEFLDDLKNQEGNSDNVLEFKQKSLYADLQDIELNLSIFRYDEQNQKILVSTNKLEMIDIFDRYIIFKDDGNAYSMSEDQYYINFQICYQEKPVGYELVGFLEDLTEDYDGVKNLTFNIVEGQQKQIEQIQEVYEKRQQAIVSFFKQAKGY